MGSLRYLSLSMLPRPVDEVYREHLHAQAPLDPVHHHLQSLTVPDHEARVIKLVGHLFEVQIGVLKYTYKNIPYKGQNKTNKRPK